MKKLKCILILLIFTMISAVAAQDAELDIDNLFENAEDIESPEDKGADDLGDSDEEEVKEEESSKGLDLLKKDTFTFGASFNVTLGYTSGWGNITDEDQDDETELADTEEDADFDDTALMMLSSKLTIDTSINDHFRFLQSYNVAFPAFEPKVSEFFADFDFGDLFYFRMGRQNLTWGISRYYKFANLHGRLPDNFGYEYLYDENDEDGDGDVEEHLFDSDGFWKLAAIDSADSIGNNDSYSIKLDVPIGIGGFQGLMYTRNGYFEDATYPAFDEFGWGANFNLAFKQADITVGGFYHKDLNTRFFYSVSTTLFNRLELYSEAVMVYDHADDDMLPIPYDAEADIKSDAESDENSDEYYEGDRFTPEEDPDRLDFGANLGFFIDFFEGNLEFTGEYYYNGEETEMKPIGARLGLPLVWGHNLAGGFAVKLLDKKLKIEAYSLYNISENTGVVAPIITLNLFEFLELKAAFPLIFGSERGEYMENNPNQFDRKFGFVLTAKVSGKK